MNAERARAWPYSLVATATHDMKRGEDVRARLAALSHAPHVWAQIVEAAERSSGEAPDANDRYMLLQTMIGAWPASARWLAEGDGRLNFGSASPPTR